MTFTAVGTGFGEQGASTISLTPGGVGNFILCSVINQASAVCTSLASTNVTWSLLGTSFAGTANLFTAQVFLGTVTSTSTATVTATFGAGTVSGQSIAGQEFSSTTGTPVLDVQGHIDTTLGNTTWASLTPATSGELYWGYALDVGAATAGSTSGYVYTAQGDGAGNGRAYNLSCAAGTATAPVWGDTGQAFGIMVLVGPAWRVLQSASTGLDPGAAAVTYPNNVVSGSKLIAFITTGGGGNPQVTAVKDAALNAMTKIGSAFLNNAAASGELSVWAMDTPAADVGTKPTLTATQAGGNQSFGFVIQEVSGLLAGNTTAMADGTAVTSTGSISANGPIACGAYSTTAAGEYLVAVGGDSENSTLTWAAPTGSTTYTRDANARNATVIFNCVPSYGSSTGAAETASSAITGAGVATAWATVFVAFKLAGSIAGDSAGADLHAPWSAPARGPGMPGGTPFAPWPPWRADAGPAPAAVTGVPAFIQRGAPSRLALRTPPRGRVFQAWGQGNQGTAFPLFAQQAQSRRLSLRTVRPARGQFFNQAWGQGNQGTRFPLYLRQAQPRPTLRRGQGKFTAPVTPVVPGFPPPFARQSSSGSQHLTLRRSQGRFFPGFLTILQVTGSAAAANNTPQITITTGQGSLLVGIFTRSGGLATGALTSVTDSAGNTWRLATRGAVSGQSNTRVECWYALNAASVVWVQGNSGTSQTWAWNIQEYKSPPAYLGLDSASPDGSAAASSTTIATPSIATTGPADLVVAAVHYAQATGVTATAGFTALSDFDDGIAGSGRGAVRAGAPPASYSVTWTLGSAHPAGTLTVSFTTVAAVPAVPAFLRPGTSAQRLMLRWSQSQGRFFGWGLGQGNQGVAFPLFTRQAQSSRQALRNPRGRFSGVPAVVATAPPPQFASRLRAVPPVRVARGRYQVPGFGQGNQGTAFPLYARQAQSKRLTLRRSEGQYFSPGQFGLVNQAFPSFTRIAGSAPRWAPRISRGHWLSPGWGQGNQGIQFPLYARQAQGTQRLIAAARRTRGIFFGQEWGQGNTGTRLPLYERQSGNASRFTVRSPRGRFFGTPAAGKVVPPPQFAGRQVRAISLRISRGRYQFPGLGQGNQGIVFPLYERQAGVASRLTLRNPRGRVFGVPVAGKVIPPPQFITRQERAVPARIPHGRFGVPGLGQGNQGAAFPLFTRQSGNASRFTLRAPRGRFFFAEAPPPPGGTPVQFPLYLRQAGLSRVTLRRSQGKFPGQAWGQGNQGVTFPLFTRQDSRRIIRPPRGRFFTPGQFNLDGNAYPSFTRQDSRRVVRYPRGKFSSPGQFSLNGNAYPGFTRQAQPKRLTLRRSQGRFFNPGQFSLSANPGLPQFTRQDKRSLVRESHGQYFSVIAFPAPPAVPGWLSPRRPKLSPPRRGKFTGIPKTAVIPAYPPEFKTTRRVNFTRADKARRGMIIQLVPFQAPAETAGALATRTGVPHHQWAEGSPGGQWKYGTDDGRWGYADPEQRWEYGVPSSEWAR